MGERLCVYFFWALCGPLFGYVLASSNSLPSSSVIQVQCTSRVLSITLTSNEDFNGVLYAGLHQQDCRILGKGQKKLEMSLPVRQCGIITVKSPDDSSKLIHKVQIYVQRHPMVQQEKDERLWMDCIAPAEVSSHGEGAIFDADQNKVEIVAPGWMEIVRGSKPDGVKVRGPVVLGETISLLVKTNLNANQDALVTKCFASDGTSSQPEMLIGETGCPTDETVMPAFQQISHEESLVTFWTKFPAFKFPDRTRLYLTCQIVVCDYSCPKPRCARQEGRSVRQVLTPQDSWAPAKIVTQMDVANSVQVVNSQLEGEVNAGPYALEEKDENRICWPLKNLMTAIGILAAILLIALLLALCFWWNRRQRKRRQMDDSYGTQSNSLYNPSTNYYYMEQYGHHGGDSQHSQSQHYSHANSNGNRSNGYSHAQAHQHQPPRVYRSETSA